MATTSRRRAPTPTIIPTHTARRIATIADVDPRTVQRVVAGDPVRPMAQRRIERAIEVLELGPLVAAAKGRR